MDLEQFWKDDELAHKENCFSEDSPQVALGIRMSEECVFAELGEEGNPWGHTPLERRKDLNKRYNDKAEKIVGKRLLREDFAEENTDAILPKTKTLEEIFEGRHVFQGGTNWVESDCDSPEKLEKLLDRVEKLDIREFILPDNWYQEKKRIFEKYGKKPQLLRGIRGPVTLATSIFGVENLIFLILDEPELAQRFSAAIGDALFKLITLLDEEGGYTYPDVPHDFLFCDDNCAMLTDEMYKEFGYPILKKIFDHWCPEPEHFRYQHSDSNMGHLIPLLADFDLTGCNFGPTVTVSEIREYMPRTRIDGQLSPLTFMNNDEDAIIAEVKRDCEMAKGAKGLNLSTAGSINNGSLLTSMRTVMYAIQKYGRY
ncbi:MAG: uroporphyrinogen decarboxylase family protein [Eubacteriales bacterium]|jgi:uroporphyrinogen decarboxylase|nr:uroporphyrinogen decarboxylase family protein [Eubacteriales bacterium]MDD4717545.1 uroporphyrinogen decarboxylase family protein [Eubacteriales bacterium]